MAAPDVTVLMPVRNGLRFLEPAIASILAQRAENFEFIICDDGSTDDTPHVLQRYASQDSRLRVFSLPAVGLVAALNRGMHEARAAWVARMDADDVAWPDRLSAQLAKAAQHPTAAAIGSAWRVIDQHGRPGAIVHPPTEPPAIAARLLEHNCLAHPTMLLRKQAVIDAGGYREAFRQAEDYDLWLRLSERHPLYALSQPLLDYREHAGQVSQQGLEQRIFAELGALVAARARRRGDADPGDGASTIDRAWLTSAGVSAADLQARLIAGALGAARYAVRTSQPGAAREALRLLRTLRGLHPRTRLHAWSLRLRVALMRGQALPR